MHIVENLRDTKEIENQIDSFVSKNINPGYKKYDAYHIIFYNASLKEIKDTHWLPDKSFEDQVYDFWWSNDRFVARHKIKNGKIIESSNDKRKIKVEPVSDSTIHQ